MNPSYKIFFNVIKVILGILIFSLLGHTLGWPTIWSTLKSTTTVSFAILLTHFFIQILFSTANVFILSRALRYHFSFKPLFVAYGAAWSLGKFLPGGLGELSIGYHFKKNGASTGDALFISIFDKMLTILSLVLVSWVGLWRFFPIKTALAINITLLGILIIFCLPFLFPSLRAIIKNYLLRSYSSKFQGFSSHFHFLIRTNKTVITTNILITILKSFAAAIAITLLFSQFGSSINIVDVFIINTLTVIVGMLPITMSGLGTKEAAAVYLYSFVGVQAVSVFAVYLILRIVSFIFAGIYLLLYPISAETKEHHSS